MSALQLETVATAAALALALLQIVKTFLEVVALLAKRRRRARRRPRQRPRRSTWARRGQGPRPGPGRGRAPPGRQRARRLEFVTPTPEFCGRVRVATSTVYTWQALEIATPYPLDAAKILAFLRLCRPGGRVAVEAAATIGAMRSTGLTPQGMEEKRATGQRRGPANGRPPRQSPSGQG